MCMMYLILMELVYSFNTLYVFHHKLFLTPSLCPVDMWKSHSFQHFKLVMTYVLRIWYHISFKNIFGFMWHRYISIAYWHDCVNYSGFGNLGMSLIFAVVVILFGLLIIFLGILVAVCNTLSLRRQGVSVANFQITHPFVSWSLTWSLNDMPYLFILILQDLLGNCWPYCNTHIGASLKNMIDMMDNAIKVKTDDCHLLSNGCSIIDIYISIWFFVLSFRPLE